jgi:LacI family transcriptional regulator
MHKENIKIPEDMEVVCFDKIESFSIANIPINFIEQPIKQMGEKSVEMLMEQINGDKEIKQIVFDAEIKNSI